MHLLIGMNVDTITMIIGVRERSSITPGHTNIEGSMSLGNEREVILLPGHSNIGQGSMTSENEGEVIHHTWPF